MSQDHSNGGSLATAGIQAHRLFKSVKEIKVIEHGQQSAEFPSSQFTAEAERFELWAVNMGLFVWGHGSLDYRVRQADGIKSTLQRFLDSLNDSLAGVLQYAANPFDQSVAEDSMLEADFSDDDDDSDLELLLDSVSDPIDRLYKLSTWIRNPSSRFATARAQFHQQIDQETDVDLFHAVQNFDVDYINSICSQYKNCKSLQEVDVEECLQSKGEEVHEEDEETATPESLLNSQCFSFLIQRLARANVNRRRQFAYWKKHREKLRDHAKGVTNQIEESSKRLTDPHAVDSSHQKTPDIALAPVQSVTTATLLNTSRPPPRDDISNATVSQYSPSVWLPHEEAIAFPPAPKTSALGSFFECPYCFTICPNSILGEKAWKAHLIHDLRPYVCIHEDCKNPDQLYDSRQDWAQHQHIAHPGEQTLCCPICCESLGELRTLQSHIALHLERFSLFSLPRSVDDDHDEQTAGDSNEANGPFAHSRDDDFDANSEFMSVDLRPHVEESLDPLPDALPPGRLKEIRRSAGVLDSELSRAVEFIGPSPSYPDLFATESQGKRPTTARSISSDGSRCSSTLTNEEGDRIYFHDRSEYLKRIRATIREAMIASGRGDIVTTEATMQLADQLEERDLLDEAEKLYRWCLRWIETDVGKVNARRVQPLNRLGRLLAMRSKPAEAEPLLREALGLSQRFNAKGAQETIRIMSNIGSVLADMAKYAEAEILYREGLEECGDEQNEDVLDLISNYGLMLAQWGKYDESEMILEHRDVVRSSLYTSQQP
ncbi:Fc.00g003340.m01.CDS01 [Cosmosporella sp. VM-42]